MTKEINKTSEEKTLQEKKAYIAPTLHRYGGLAELTQNTSAVGMDAGTQQPNGRS